MTLICFSIPVALLVLAIQSTYLFESTAQGEEEAHLPIMFWRLQKVGSSSIHSMLLSLAFRHNLPPRAKSGRNSLCKKLDSCLPLQALNDTRQMFMLVKAVFQRKYGSRHSRLNGGNSGGGSRKDFFDTKRFMVSTQHEICNLDASFIRNNLPCAFHSLHNAAYHTDIRELFLLREPVARALSIYYFWGELSKLTRKTKRTNRNQLQLGEGTSPSSSSPRHNNSSRDGLLFFYHGNESTAPSLEVAEQFAARLPHAAGGVRRTAGPSFSYSAFAEDSLSAVKEVMSDRMVTLVLERLDESLVMMTHVWNWSLADAVIVMPRKSLSPHPRAEDWPQLGIEAIRERLRDAGELDLYDAAVRKLDERIAALKQSGVAFSSEVNYFRELRRRATEVSPHCAYAVKMRLMFDINSHCRFASQTSL